VSDPERVVEKLGNHEAERRTTERVAEGLGSLLEAPINPGVVSVGEGRSGKVTADEGIVRVGAAIVRLGDESAGGGVEGAREDVMPGAHFVVTRIVVEDRIEDSVTDDVLTDESKGGGAEPLAVCAGVSTVVGTVVEQLAVLRGGGPSDDREESEGLPETENDLVVRAQGWSGLAWLNCDIASTRDVQEGSYTRGDHCIWGGC